MRDCVRAARRLQEQQDNMEVFTEPNERSCRSSGAGPWDPSSLRVSRKPVGILLLRRSLKRSSTISGRCLAKTVAPSLSSKVVQVMMIERACLTLCVDGLLSSNRTEHYLPSDYSFVVFLGSIRDAKMVPGPGRSAGHRNSRVCAYVKALLCTVVWSCRSVGFGGDGRRLVGTVYRRAYDCIRQGLLCMRFWPATSLMKNCPIPKLKRLYQEKGYPEWELSPGSVTAGTGRVPLRPPVLQVAF